MGLLCFLKRFLRIINATPAATTTTPMTIGTMLIAGDTVRGEPSTEIKKIHVLSIWCGQIEHFMMNLYFEHCSVHKYNVT